MFQQPGQLGADSQGMSLHQNPSIQSKPLPSQPWQHQGLNQDNIIPGTDALRGNSTVSEAAASVLVSYDAQALTSILQGKQPTLSTTSHHSGRYHLSDTCNVPPQYRWLSEGYRGSAGMKSIAYEDLILPQWAVRQLSNMHQIEDLVGQTVTTSGHSLYQRPHLTSMAVS